MKKKLLIGIFAIIIIVIGLNLWMERDKSKAISNVSITTIKNIPTIDVSAFYKQRDKKWASDKLGNTSETLGKVGCLVCSIGMNLSYYGIDMNPKEINKKLTTVDGYTFRGWLIWNKLSKITEDKVSVLFPKLSHENIDKNLLTNTPVLAKLFIHRIIPHWVLIVGKKDGEYIILDPLAEGKVTNFSSYDSYIYSIRVLKINENKND
ncbi:MAG: cysteine peptidase family C39 domain-containing protein [Sulfurovum sp.]